MTRVIQHYCARFYECAIEGLETGVKRRAEIVCLQEPPRERGVIGISHLAYKIRKSTTVCTAKQQGSGLVVDEQKDLSRRANDHVIATDFRRRGEKIIRIVNIYDQKEAQSGERERQA